MAIVLTPFEALYGALTFIGVIISVLLGILIAFKYFKFKKIDFLLVGLTWIFLVSPYWSDAIQFITIMIFGTELNPDLYFFIANAFIAPIHIVWIYAISDFLFPIRKKALIAIFSIEAIAFEAVFLWTFFLDPALIGDQKSWFVVEWAIWIQIYLLVSIALFLVTGFLFAGRSLKSQNKDLKLKGKFLIVAFVSFTIAAVIDVVGAETPNELTIFLARTFLIISSICFYIGFILPRFIKGLFIQE
ncbi:MAG: hypothetical protein EU542_05715 [Promethearchaeota archaeon]|nr:MAG: hypothetical protein EU542_05715 [Candidatus Lokiarchaeota archaeon]